MSVGEWNGEVRRTLKRALPEALRVPLQRVHWNWRMNRGIRAYSQEGEDLLLNKIFLEQAEGFYVDVGACHPIHYSNTYLFYRRGWRGINIDPTPGCKQVFDRRRPRDVNLEIGIGSEPGTRSFYMFDNTVLNTFDETARDRGVALKSEKSFRALECRIERLDAVLSRELPENQQIDFMNIDVEGSEIDVIQSNDWTRFRPKVLCVEILGTSIGELFNHPVTELLADLGYSLSAKINFSSFFHEKNFDIPLV